MWTDLGQFPKRIATECGQTLGQFAKRIATECGQTPTLFRKFFRKRRHGVCASTRLLWKRSLPAAPLSNSLYRTFPVDSGGNGMLSEARKVPGVPQNPLMCAWPVQRSPSPSVVSLF